MSEDGVRDAATVSDGLLIPHPVLLMPPFHRRDFLKTVGASAAASLGAAACLPAKAGYILDRSGVRGGPRRFVPVDARPENHVRSTVGLRPFRNSGFRLESERLDGKQLIHNYGHGGGGITLSWGTANIAVGMIRENPPPGPVAVIGAGVIGLTTAELLQRLGYDVVIYTAAAWPHTTSNASAATFYPSHVIAADRVTPAFTSRLEAALYRSYHAFQRMTGSRYAVKWLDSFGLQHGPQPTGGEPDVETRVHLKVVGDSSRVLDRSEHPFAADRVTQGRDLVIEPMTYLKALLDDVRTAGATMRIRRFDSVRDLAQLPERTIFNCTGLGSKAMLGDNDLRPARGQLCVFPPQPRVDYTLYHGPFYYMVPREDGIILGGTFELDATSTTADAATDKSIIAAHQAVFSAMR